MAILDGLTKTQLSRLRVRFWNQVNKRGVTRQGVDGRCWEWIGGKTQGYGTFWIGEKKRNGRTHNAHRVVWELENGAIPDGLFVLHKCDNPACVNPAHLFLGTNKDNQDDMTAKKRRRNSRTGKLAETVEREKQGYNSQKKQWWHLE